MSNVIMAFVSVVNGFQGDRAGSVVDPQPSVRSIAHDAVAPDRSGVPYRTVVPSGRSIRSVAAFAALSAAVAIAISLRGRYLRWGATTGEQHQTLAGDELLSSVDQSATRAITINAAADDVWPWIAQLGQGRGGFYSYDWLENRVAHIDIHNADRIVPQWQQIAIGAEVQLAPEVRLQVAALEPGRALVLRGSVPMGKVPPPYEFTWAFVLLPQPDGSTRLVVRERYAYTHRWAATIVQPAALVSCLMSPKMLRGIKSRAEQAVTRLAPTEPPRIVEGRTASLTV